MEKEIICVICPSSCHIKVCGVGERIDSVTGNGCKRGKEYASTEFVAPKRTVTSTVRAKGYVAPVIPVRTNLPIPKESMMECMRLINQLEIEAPFEVGRVVIENVLDSGADVILANC